MSKTCAPSLKLQNSYGYGIRHVQMLIMCLAIFILFTGRGCMSVAILAMTDISKRNDTNITIYDWDKKTQDMILSSFFWGYMVMQIPGGILGKRFGGKIIILVGLLSNATLSLVLPLIAQLGWYMVCIARVLMGMTQACVFPTTYTLLGKWLPTHERTALAGFVYGGIQLGTIAAMPISGLLAETSYGWKLIYYVTAGIMFFVAAIWHWLSASSPAEHRMISADERHYIEMGLHSSISSTVSLRVPWMDMFRSKPVWAIVVAHIAGGIVFILFFVELPTYLEMGLDISLKKSAFLSAIPFAGMWVGAVTSGFATETLINRGYLSMRACRNIFSSLALFGSAVGMICLSFLGAEKKTWALIVLIVTLMMVGCMFSAFMINHLDLSPNFGGVLFGFTNTISLIGGLFAPITTGLILQNDPADVTRWRIVFLTAAALCISCNVFYLIFSSTEKQYWDDPQYSDKQKADLEEIQPVKDTSDENYKE